MPKEPSTSGQLSTFNFKPKFLLKKSVFDFRMLDQNVMLKIILLKKNNFV